MPSTARRPRKPAEPVCPPAVAALIAGAIAAYREAVPADDSPGWPGMDRVWSKWDGLGRPEQLAAIRWVDSNTPIVDGCSDDRGRFLVFIAGCARGVEVEMAPTPDGLTREVRPNAGRTRLMRETTCSTCRKPLDRSESHYIADTHRSTCGKQRSISFFHHHVGCVELLPVPAAERARVERRLLEIDGELMELGDRVRDLEAERLRLAGVA